MDEVLAKRSAYLFSSFRICINLAENPLAIFLLNMLRYSFIRSPFCFVVAIDVSDNNL